MTKKRSLLSKLVRIWVGLAITGVAIIAIVALIGGSGSLELNNDNSKMLEIGTGEWSTGVKSAFFRFGESDEFYAQIAFNTKYLKRGDFYSNNDPDFWKKLTVTVYRGDTMYHPGSGNSVQRFSVEVLENTLYRIKGKLAHFEDGRPVEYVELDYLADFKGLKR